MGAVIEAQELRKDFEQTVALRSLSVTVASGELFGLVGPDGAGKTTTLRLLAGLLTPTDGRATVVGYDLESDREAIKPHIGYMAQEFSLYGELSVTENLQFFADLHGLSRQVYRERSERLLEFAALSDFQDRRAQDLSGGMKKKLALAATLIHEPPLLLLDEPTTGVDPISRREFWRILTELNVEGTTVVVSTPYMDEAERCQRVGLLYAGDLVVCDEPSAIRDQVPGELLRLRPRDWRQARALVDDLPGVIEVQSYGQVLHLIVDSADRRRNQIARAMEEGGAAYDALEAATPRMEEAFISLIRQLERD